MENRISLNNQTFKYYRMESDNKESNELLDLTIIEQNKDSIDKLIDVEIDTAVQIINEVKEIPYADKIIKFCQVGYGILNIWHLRKIAKFLKGSESISDEEKDNYLASLDKKDKQRISGYLANLLYLSEDEEKAEIIGIIYAARVRNMITNEEMLRLCSDVNKVFVFDIRNLVEYMEPCEYKGFVTDNLYTGGLLEQMSSAEQTKDEQGYIGMSLGVRKYKLNRMGEILFTILTEAGCLN